MAQLPAEARGTAAAVLTFSFISEIAGFLLIWLVWTHRERTSYVALIAYFTWLATTTSIIQQIHLYVRWDEVMIRQFEHTVANVQNPELIISSSTTGMDLILFYIRYASFTIAATLVMFWGLFLALSMYGRSMIVANGLGKVIAIIVPTIFISLLQIDDIKSSYMGFLVLADLPLIIGLVGGCIFVGIIIRKYIQTRRQFRASSIGYRWDFGGSRIYDRWLLIRFSVGFFILALFNMTNIICQVAWQANTERDALSAGPDTSAARARHDSALFLPGVSSSLLAFVIFGTTTPFREHMRKVFLAEGGARRHLRLRPAGPQSPPRPKSPSMSSGGSPRHQAAPPTGGGGSNSYYEVTVYGPQGRRTTSISYSGPSVAAAARPPPLDEEEGGRGAGGTRDPAMKRPAGGRASAFFHRREEPEPAYDGRYQHQHQHQHQRSASAPWS